MMAAAFLCCALGDEMNAHTELAHSVLRVTHSVNRAGPVKGTLPREVWTLYFFDVDRQILVWCRHALLE